MPENIRLVIWDLDDTFWDGTLTEGSVRYRQAHHDIVLELARRGIVSSICSKNDLAPVRAKLQQHGLWDSFVFPSIGWQPKGARIAALIEAIQLRPATVLFIDDNPAHLQEACEHAPGLQVAGPEAIAGLLADPRCRGKDDAGLTRLAQYQLLQQRHADMTAAAAGQADNTAFLRASDIRVTIEHDVASHIDRAVELVNRTNQLNFTKSRLPEEPDAARAELLMWLRAFDVQAGLLRVTDRYGDYGYAGFYLVAGAAGAQRLVHFCFSCRILGMSVERWLYDRLGRPALEVQGEVLADPAACEPAVDWVKLAAPGGAGQAAPPLRQIPAVRVRGGCDGQALVHYFGLASPDVRGEFNIVRGGAPVRLDHSCMLRLALEGPDPDRLAALAPLGFTADDLRTDYFSAAPAGSVWVFSNWIDPIINVYRHRTLGFRVPFLIQRFGQADLSRLPEQELQERLAQTGADDAEIAAKCAAAAHLRAHFDCEGLLPEAATKANLALIFAQVPPDGRLFVLLTAEGHALPPHTSPALAARQARLNQLLRETAAAYPAVSLIDVNASVHDPSEVLGLTHFDRMVYFRLYTAMLAALGPAGSAAAA